MRSLTAHLEKNDAMAVALIERKLTVQKSIESGLQINKAMKSLGETETIKLISRTIENTVKYFGVEFTHDQLIQTSIAIIDRYEFDNIEDIIIALKRAKGGLCEKVYGRINGETILRFIEQYMDIKAAEIERNHNNNKYNQMEIHKCITDEIQKHEKLKINRVKMKNHTREDWIEKFILNIQQHRVKELENLRASLLNDNIFKQNNDLIAKIETEINNRKSKK